MHIKFGWNPLKISKLPWQSKGKWCIKFIEVREENVYYRNTWNYSSFWTNFYDDINMNKTEFIAAVAEEAGLSKTDAAKAVKAFTDVVTEEMKKGEKVQLIGFGNFEVSKRPAREGINPATKEKITIAAANVPKFKAGKALKEALN